MPITKSGNAFLNSLHQANVRNMIMNYETDADGDPIYVGYAARGSDDDWPAWYIEKHVNGHVDGVGGTYTIRISKENQVWDNRATTVEYA